MTPESRRGALRETVPDETGDLLARTVDLVTDYLRTSAVPDAPVSDRLTPDELREAMDLGLPDEGSSFSELLPVIASYLKHTTRTASRRFLNQLFSGFDLPGVVGEIVSAASNTSMYTYEVAPVATVMEKELIARMARMAGFDSGEGVFVNGGSNANMVAMLCARHRNDADAKSAGLRGRRLVAFVSDQAHYSLLIAANLLGIGTDNVVRVRSDHLGRMIPGELVQAIERARSEGGEPFFVGATAGTTVLGAFDPLVPIAEVARRQGTWLHVDGAWGAPVLFSDRHRGLLEGIERADSFAWDAHKLMAVPLLCTALLVREPGTLVEVCSSEGTDYIYHDNPEETNDLGPMSLQCGRKVESLKLWLAWKYHGASGYGRRIDHLMELAAATRRRIDGEPRLELMAEPSFLNLCFRYLPEACATPSQVDAFNRSIRDRLAESGRALVNYAHLGDRVTIRLVLPNAELTEADLAALLEDIVATGRAVEDGRHGTGADPDDETLRFVG